jgi:hypothetical protein
MSFLLDTVARLDVHVLMCTVGVTGSEALRVPEGSGEA